MKTATATATAKAPGQALPVVQVELPVVKLKVEDLAYLRMVAGTTASCVRNGDSSRSRDRLLFLGLIEPAVIPPCPKALKEWQEKEPKAIKIVRDALGKLDWKTINDTASDMRYRNKKPEAVNGFVLTAAGKELLKKGLAQSRVTKEGCL